jgi:hypothetical protein
LRSALHSIPFLFLNLTSIFRLSQKHKIGGLSSQVLNTILSHLFPMQDTMLKNFLGFEELNDEEREEIRVLREEIKNGEYVPFGDVFYQ